MPVKQIVIVGAGEAAISAADALRTHGYDGRMILLSEQEALPYPLPPLSKDCLQDEARTPDSIKPASWFAAHNIDIIYGATAQHIDPVARHVRYTLRGKTYFIDYQKLILATGSRARRFADDAPFAYLRTLTDCENLRTRLADARTIAIVGGGVIGLEIAAIARARGLSVQIFEAAPRLMARALPPTISQLIYDLHISHGVAVHIGKSDITISRDGLFVDAQHVPADLYIAGIGAIPNSEIAETAGCKVDNGIIVDGQGETSVRNIYATGDVARLAHPFTGQLMRIETWQHAQRHGAHVGRAILEKQPDYDVLPWFWTDQYGVNFQTVGFPADADHSIKLGKAGDARATYVHLKGPHIVAATTINNGRDIRPLTSLIMNRWPVDRDALISPDVSLRALAQNIL